MNPHTRVAVDVGGTFTDIVKLTPATGEFRFEKVPTTPRAPSEGVLSSFDRVEVDMAEVAAFHRFYPRVLRPSGRR